MLQSFMWMCNASLQRHMLQKKTFRLFYFPDAQFCGCVYTMLKK